MQALLEVMAVSLEAAAALAAVVAVQVMTVGIRAAAAQTVALGGVAVEEEPPGRTRRRGSSVLTVASPHLQCARQCTSHLVEWRRSSS